MGRRGGPSLSFYGRAAKGSAAREKPPKKQSAKPPAKKRSRGRKAAGAYEKPPPPAFSARLCPPRPQGREKVSPADQGPVFVVRLIAERVVTADQARIGIERADAARRVLHVVTDQPHVRVVQPLHAITSRNQYNGRAGARASVGAGILRRPSIPRALCGGNGRRETFFAKGRAGPAKKAGIRITVAAETGGLTKTVGPISPLAHRRRVFRGAVRGGRRGRPRARRRESFCRNLRAGAERRRARR